LTELLWKEGVPEFSVLWMSDPDRTQHETGPGTPDSFAAMKSADANLGVLLRVLDERGALERTDILVASDHGFSTIERTIDVAALLAKAGFKIAEEQNLTLARGEIRIAANGGTSLYEVGERDPETVARLIEFLQQSDFAGVIFSRELAEGTFPLSQLHLETASGPDVVMAFRWNSNRNASGVAGMVMANRTTNNYKGTHGTLSPFDVRNTFIAAGPDFASGTSSELPTANIDVAATIVHLLGITPPEPLDGRVVAEAMPEAAKEQPVAATKTLEASRKFEGGEWRQYLRTSIVGGSVYFDEGNGEFRTAEAQ
jgi:arylsulfatase A-like enzyme